MGTWLPKLWSKAISQVEREMSQLAADMIDQLTSRTEQLGEVRAN